MCSFSLSPASILQLLTVKPHCKRTSLPLAIGIYRLISAQLNTILCFIAFDAGTYPGVGLVCFGIASRSIAACVGNMLYNHSRRGFRFHSGRDGVNHPGGSCCSKLNLEKARRNCNS